MLYTQKMHIASDNAANKKANLTSTDGDNLDSIVFVDFIWSPFNKYYIASNKQSMSKQLCSSGIGIILVHYYFYNRKIYAFLNGLVINPHKSTLNSPGGIHRKANSVGDPSIQS